MANFDRAIKKVLRREGGYVDHPSDPGGATNYGISERWMRRVGIEGHPKDLTLAEAIKLYQKYFWEPYAFAKWRNQELAEVVFDATVNMGPSMAMRLFQRALRAVGHDVSDDGLYGPATDRALQLVDSSGELSELLAAFRSEMAGRYRQLVERNPSYRAFLDGWLRRAYQEIE